jgi:hypothetical protein
MTSQSRVYVLWDPGLKMPTPPEKRYFISTELTIVKSNVLSLFESGVYFLRFRTGVKQVFLESCENDVGAQRSRFVTQR